MWGNMLNSSKPARRIHDEMNLVILKRTVQEEVKRSIETTRHLTLILHTSGVQ
jgi:hypothetical protein